MAIDNRIQTEFTSDRNTFYRVTIIDTLSSTSTLYTDVENSEDGFVLTYETEDDNRFTGLIPSKCEFSFYITDSSGNGNQVNINGIINSIRISDYKRWQLKIEVGPNDSSYSLFWVGNLLNDINPEDDISLPRKVTLTAICGLGALDNIPFNEDVSYNFNASYTPYRYIFNCLTNDIDTENNWGSTDVFIRTVVDWTNSVIPRNATSDPLNLSRFKASAYAPINDNGVRQPKTAFKLLDDICKAFGARLFLSNGKFQFIQVNSYHRMRTVAQFFRDYYKTNNGSTYTPNATGTYQTDIKTEGATGIQRLAGNDFDQLGILKQVRVTYDQQKSYDLEPLTINGNPTPVNNALVAWNGWHSTGESFNTDGGIYGINDDPSSPISFGLGSISQISGLTIRIKRNFNRAFLGNLASLQAIIPNTGLILFYHRLKLVGSSETRYARSTYTEGGQSPWTTNSAYGNAPDYNSASAAGSIGYVGLTPNNTFLLDFETEEIPFDGSLFFECYAQLFLTDGTTEITNPTDQQKFYIFSAPENSEEEIMQVYIDGSSTSQQTFTNTQNISNGLTYDVGEVFFGSGPNATAQGRLESSADGVTFDDGTNTSWVAYGSGSGQSISKLLTEEIMIGQFEGASVFNGSLKITSQNDGNNGYKFNNGLNLDSKFYIPYQCSFIANRDTWEGEWYEIESGSPTQTFELISEDLNTTDLQFQTSNSW